MTTIIIFLSTACLYLLAMLYLKQRHIQICHNTIRQYKEIADLNEQSIKTLEDITSKQRGIMKSLRDNSEFWKSSVYGDHKRTEFYKSLSPSSRQIIDSSFARWRN